MTTDWGIIMKKIGLICAAVLVCGSLTACGNQSSKKASSSSKSNSSKVVKHHKKQNKKKQSSSSSASSNSNSQSNNQQASTQQSNTGNQQEGKSQSEINRERGYDPNGAPLLPGQDHAAGSNPDGSPDALVQWQLDHQNDTTFPDGTPFPNGGDDNNQQ